MCIYIYIYIYAYCIIIFVHAHATNTTNTYTYISVHIHLSIYIHMHVNNKLNKCAYLCTSISWFESFSLTYMNIRIDGYTYVWICIKHVYIYIYMNIWLCLNEYTFSCTDKRTYSISKHAYLKDNTINPINLYARRTCAYTHKHSQIRL